MPSNYGKSKSEWTPTILCAQVASSLCRCTRHPGKLLFPLDNELGCCAQRRRSDRMSSMMNKIVLTVTLLLALMWSDERCAWARASPYVLDVRVIATKNDVGDLKIVRLKNKHSNRIIWTRKVYGPGPEVFWSKDRRAVAVQGFSLLVWREGHQLRDFGRPAGRDYFMGCVWSPNKRRLLFRCGASGSSMVGDNGAGSLFCLTLGPKPFYKCAPIDGGVTEMKWRNNRTVLYNALNYDAKGEVLVKSYVWRIR